MTSPIPGLYNNRLRSNPSYPSYTPQPFSSNAPPNVGYYPANGTPPGADVRFNYQEEDPGWQGVQNRGQFYSQGMQLDQDIASQTGSSRYLADYFRGGAQSQYDNMQGPSQDQIDAMMREGQYNDLLGSQDFYNNQYLTPEEQASMTGNPDTGFDYWNPNQGWDMAGHADEMTTNAVSGGRGQLGQVSSRYQQGTGEALSNPNLVPSDQWNNWLNGQISDTTNTVRDSAGRLRAATQDPNLNVSSGFRPGIDSTLDQGSAAANASANRPDTLMDSAYGGRLRNTLGQTKSSLDTTLNDPNLQLRAGFGNDYSTSADYDKNYQFGDKDITDLESNASNVVRGRTTSAINDLEARAAAEDNTSPLAIAAARQRYETSSAADAADAATAARSQGKQIALGVAAQREAARREGLLTPEQLRLSSGQNLAGLKTSSALALGQQGLGAEENIESTRLDAAQRQAQLQNSTALSLMQSRLTAQFQAEGLSLDAAQKKAALVSSNESTIGSQGLALGGQNESAGLANENLNLGANQWKTGQQLDAAKNLYSGDSANTQYITGADVANQNTIGERDLGVWNTNTNTGINLANAADTARTGRATTLATNRQTTGLAGQEQRFGQGAVAQGRLSDTATRLQAAQDAKEAERRNFYNTNAQFNATNATTQTGQRTQNLGTYGSLMNQATQGNVQWGMRQPGWSRGIEDASRLISAVKAPSDIRLKHSIAPAPPALPTLLSIPISTFEYLPGSGPTGERVGTMAQILEPLIPSAVGVGPHGMKYIDYGILIPLLIKAIQEQQSQITTLQSKLEAK